jgi:hypothetical protein
VLGEPTERVAINALEFRYHCSLDGKSATRKLAAAANTEARSGGPSSVRANGKAVDFRPRRRYTEAGDYQ